MLWSVIYWRWSAVVAKGKTFFTQEEVLIQLYYLAKSGKVHALKCTQKYKSKKQPSVILMQS
jgi:hypothetical protein